MAVHAGIAPAPAGAGTEQVDVSMTTTLMHHSQAGFPVDAEHPIAVVHDASGAPIVFSLSSDAVPHLYAIMRMPAVATGWESRDLSSALGADLAASAFAVSQAADGTITLALAAGAPSRLFLTAPLPNDTSAAAWQAFTDSWV